MPREPRDVVTEGLWTGIGTALGGIVVVLLVAWLFEWDPEASTDRSGGLLLSSADEGAATGCGWL